MTMPMFPVCPNPVFIVGAPRSGTTLFRLALGLHSQLWSSEEGDFLQPILEATNAAWRLGNRYGRYQWLPAEGVTEEEFWRYTGMGINALYTSRAGDRIWVEKTPDYSRFVEPLSRLFPGARFLNIQRDAKDVINSMRQRWGWSHRRACKLWQDCTLALMDYTDRAPQRILSVQFDELTTQPEAVLESVYHFLDVESDPLPAAYIRNNPAVNTAPTSEGIKSGRWNWFHRQWFKKTCNAIEMQASRNNLPGRQLAPPNEYLAGTLQRH